MALQVVCPACEQTFPVQTPLAGEDTTCPHCSRQFNIHLEGQIRLTPLPPTGTPRSVARGIRFTFSCVRCSSILEATDQLCGRSGRCPTCGGIFTVPMVDHHTGLAVGAAQVADDGQLPTPMHAYATAGTKAPTIRRRSDGESVIICPRCQREMPVDANTCSACGIPFTMEGAELVAQGAGESNSLASFALTVGVLSIPTFCMPVLGVVAVILGLLAIRRAGQLGSEAPGRRMALTGLLLGILSIVMFVLSLLMR